jgi:transporter family protein
VNYIVFAVIALVTYSFVAPLSKLASQDIPIMVVALGSNVVITAANLAVVLYLDEGLVSSLSSPKVVYVIGAGVFLTVGVLTYFYALSIGPVSVVAPIFGMFLVGSAVIGMVALGEAVTVRKIAGLGLAALAVYLTAGT